MKSPRKLTVILNGDKDKYRFEGFWTGKDITLVRSHLERKYRLYVRELRRNNLHKPTEQPTVTSVWGYKLGGE